MHKMVLMEVWRAIWAKTFKSLRRLHHYVFAENYYDALWEQYAPGWLRRGVRTSVVTMVQRNLQNVIYGWVTKGWDVVSIGLGIGSGWVGFEFVQDGDVDTSTATSTSSSTSAVPVEEGEGEGSDNIDLELLSEDLDIEVVEMEFDDSAVPASIDESFDMDDNVSIFADDNSLVDDCDVGVEMMDDFVDDVGVEMMDDFDFVDDGSFEMMDDFDFDDGSVEMMDE